MLSLLSVSMCTFSLVLCLKDTAFVALCEKKIFFSPMMWPISLSFGQGEVKGHLIFWWVVFFVF